MRVVVTGGDGFLGRHVVQGLAARGHEPVIFDMASPTPDHLNYQRPRIVGNLLDTEKCSEAAATADAICHLAGVGDVYLAHAHPDLAAEYNAVGTARLLEACRDVPLRKFVYASTWEVYGRPLYQPIDEEHPCNPDHPYNITKYAGERLAMAYQRLWGAPTVALRLGTAYGPGMRPNSVFSAFIAKALAGEALTIHGSGTQTRQFTHAFDIASAFVDAVEGAAPGEVFNIVSHEEISILKLAEMIGARIPSELRFEGARSGDIESARISSAKAHDVLGWTPRVLFGQGLEGIIAEHERAHEAARLEAAN